MNIGKAIYGILSGTTEVTDIVGTKIFPEIAEQETAVPFVIYQVQSVQPEDTHDGPSKLDEVRVEVLCYDDAYNGAADLASAVRGALDRVRGTYNGVNVESVQFNDVDFEIEYDPRRYSQVLTFTFRIKRDDIEIALGTPITGAQLGDLSDVNVTGVTDNQILSYDAASDTWVPAADAGGPDVLDDLSDVDTGEPEDNQMLAYQQGTWTAIYQDEIVLPIASVTGLQTELNTIPDGLDDLDDVKIIGTPAEGDALVYQSGFWSRGTAGASTLGDLDDVNTTGAGVGSTIVYNGSTWEISGSELPSDDIYYHNRYLTEAGTLRSGATETVELYYTAQADGDGLSESASSDTPTSGYDIQRKLWYAEKAQADPDTSADWTQFTAIADNTTFNNAKAALLAYLKERTGGTVPISLKMTWEEVAQAPSFTGLLNESYGSGAEAAYSTRRLNGNVTDCMVIRRASDSTTETIGFDGSGNIDESAIETFCTGTTCTVVTWKDQSGNGNDATAPSTGDEPTIYTGGALVKDGGKVALDFDGSNDKFQLGLSITNADSLSYFYTGNYIGSGAANQWMVQTSESPQLFVPVAEEDDTNTSIIFGVSSTSYYASGTSVTLANRGDVYAAFAGKQTLSSIFGSSTVTLSNSYLGGRVGNNYMVNGLFQEFILYTNNKSSVRTDIEENIGDYFTQNTPLLDTYSGAAAAYSLRLLDSSYVGSAVEVYNGSSYADIGFNVFGELDTVALAAHCGSNDGFVSKWYDQAGSNDATQTTTSNMPKIYDGTTGVETSNGKPAVRFINSSTTYLDAPDLGADTTTTYFEVHDRNGSNLNVWSPDRNENAVLADGLTFVSGAFYNGVTASIGGSLKQPLTAGDIQDYRLVYWLRNGTNSELGVNASTVVTGTQSSSVLNRLRLGTRAGLTLPFDGYMSEFVMYRDDQSSNRTNIEDNINTFYNIY